MTAKEYWDKAEQLRKRIKRKKHEICILHQRAEGMGDSSMNNMPKTASPQPNKMEGIICEILALEQEVKAIQQEYDILVAGMKKRIQQIDNDDARDLLTKRYLEFKRWRVIATEFGYSVQHTYYLHTKALEKVQS